MSENHFFWPKSIIFQPISMKLGKNVQNRKTKILVNFGRNWTPPWRHQGGSKHPKMSFFDQIRTFFNQSLWNLPKMLRMEKHKFWCIFTEICPLYDVIRGSKNPKNEFLALIRTFSHQSLRNLAKLLKMETHKTVKNAWGNSFRRRRIIRLRLYF